MSTERKLTYVGGDSAKFWHVRQDATELVIRYGRLDAEGRTQVTSFDSEAAATAAVEKLVAEKLRKGYTEDDTAAPETAAPDDEDVLTMPAAWLRALHPRRGGVRVPERRRDADADAKVAARVAEHRQMIRDCLELTTDPGIAEAGATWLDGDAAGGPLGAAVVAEVVAAHLNWDDSAMLAAFAETWLAERGLVFAAEAVVELISLKCGDDSYYYRSFQPAMPVRRLPDGTGTSRWWFGHAAGLPARVRAAVAAAGDAEYAEVVAVLTRCREAGAHHRMATSYLAPSEVAWVDADCAEAAAPGTGQSQGLITAVSTPAQAALIADDLRLFWVSSSLAVPATVVDGMGEAAVPVLTDWLDRIDGADERKRLQSVLAELPGDAAMQVLIDRVDGKYGQPALLRAAARFPRRAMRLMAASKGKVVAELLRAHVLAHPDLVGEVLAEVDGTVAAQRIGALADTAAVAVAPPEALPEVLVSPPWTRPRVVRTPVVIDGLVCAGEPATAWAPGERDAWRSSAPDWCERGHLTWEQMAAVVSGPRRNGWFEGPTLIVAGPEELARPVLETWRPDHMWQAADWMRAAVARFEFAALPLVVHYARKQAAEVAPALLPLATPEIAVLMADWLARLKSVRATALAWFSRHPDAAARALVPPALGKPGSARRQAEQALSALVAGGHRDAVTRAAAGYGPAAEAAIAELLAAGPLDALPAKMPATPQWADPSILTRIHLRGGGLALPLEAARHVVTMLAISRPGDPYAGIALVKEACDERSLADFGWALFQRWQAAGHPSKESWMFDALALIGDDETVRRLTPLIRAWPGEGGHARAVTGLDVLATLGTEVALMHLHGVAEKVKFTGLKNRARLKMAEVAGRLNLTPEELADRLVPDFGLAADGSLTLDYGPRRFVVGFDEQLKPYVVDEAGKRLKTLPKPGVKDDAELAPEAYRRFAGLKKDVRTVAADTIHRLERAMADRRRWGAGDFARLFVGHPLLWHITRRLVWGYYDADGALLGTLRVAEDRGFADVDDETLTLPGGVTVGLVHPLELGETLGAWAEVFADYEILQPFPQLGRDVYTAPDALDPDRFTKIPTGRVLGLERRGWRRGAPQDAGWQGWIEREAPGGRIVTIHLAPGVCVGYVDMEEEQTVMVEEGHFRGLDPITVSEIMRDLEELVR
ncbi:DUF4132 domain-containing protein [Herbidospora daliensis]|uniref:DUF4132 domain-containing protein n=1 Tax=Herbidospora daliensis TaxID=295585 RepID=UPI000783BC99|nr:DUF4132 domain-containing protein [Herbidospora daliensis]